MLIADAEAAYAFAAARYPAERIVLWGETLGSGVAVALGAGYRAGRIVLDGSFTSAADLGAAHAYRFLPVRLLMKDQFRSDLRIAKVTAPLLFLHGGRDWVVPIVLGERLYVLGNDLGVSLAFARRVEAASSVRQGLRITGARGQYSPKNAIKPENLAISLMNRISFSSSPTEPTGDFDRTAGC